MNKERRMFMIIFGSLSLLFLAFLIISINKGYNENLSYNFSGVVSSVTYDEKGTPTITLNHHEYVLSAGYNFDYKIEIGDSLTKFKSSTVYRLKKRKTKAVIEFDN